LPTATITKDNGNLPGLLRFGFAGSTGGSTNVHEILCFQANPAQLADTSVGVNQKQATQIGQRHPGIPGDVLSKRLVGHR